MPTDQDKDVIEKKRFISEIESDLATLDFQRDRIFQDPINPQDVRGVHDADFYMVLLRRLYRRIEKTARHDSRVADLKGRHKELYKKIKIRDHFEHGVDVSKFTQNIIVIGGLVINGEQSHIISGDQQWFLYKDHNQFKELLNTFVQLYPYLDSRPVKPRFSVCKRFLHWIEQFFSCHR